MKDNIVSVKPQLKSHCRSDSARSTNHQCRLLNLLLECLLGGFNQLFQHFHLGSSAGYHLAVLVLDFNIQLDYPFLVVFLGNLCDYGNLVANPDGKQELQGLGEPEGSVTRYPGAYYRGNETCSYHSVNHRFAETGLGGKVLVNVKLIVISAQVHELVYVRLCNLVPEDLFLPDVNVFILHGVIPPILFSWPDCQIL